MIETTKCQAEKRKVEEAEGKKNYIGFYSQNLFFTNKSL